MVPHRLKYTAVILFDKSWMTNLRGSMKNDFETTKVSAAIGSFVDVLAVRENERGFRHS